jgi:tellurite resistance protein
MTRIWYATGIAVLGLTLTACATRSCVTQQVDASEERTAVTIGELQTEVEATQAEISQLQEEDAPLEGLPMRSRSVSEIRK